MAYSWLTVPVCSMTSGIGFRMVDELWQEAANIPWIGDDDDDKDYDGQLTYVYNNTSVAHMRKWREHNLYIIKMTMRTMKQAQKGYCPKLCRCIKYTYTTVLSRVVKTSRRYATVLVSERRLVTIAAFTLRCASLLRNETSSYINYTQH